MTIAELKTMLAEVDKQLVDSVRLGHIHGIDYSWKARTKRRNLASLHNALHDLIEYAQHEHFQKPSFCRPAPAKKQ